MSLTVEQINDILDAKPSAATLPGSEETYGSMMAQQAKSEGHKAKLPPRVNRCLDEEQKIAKVVAILKEHGPMGRLEIAKHLEINEVSVYDYTRFAKQSGAVELIHANTARAKLALKGS